LSAADTLVLVTHKARLLALVDRVVVVSPQGVMLDGPRDQVLQHLQQSQAQTTAPNTSAASATAARRPDDAKVAMTASVLA
jgi:ATP-binding cassette subfamily C protein LapB